MKHLFIKLFALLLLSTQVLSGCSEPTTGAVEVHWDRDNCERCRMVLSDHKHAAQIRFMNEKQKSVVYKFDDIGCAVIWLENKPWRDTNSTEIWVTDYTDGKWIDAKTAYYVKDHVTPMEFGLGAQKQPAQDAISFAEASKHIFEKEAATNMHGGHRHH